MIVDALLNLWMELQRSLVERSTVIIQIIYIDKQIAGVTYREDCGIRCPITTTYQMKLNLLKVTSYGRLEGVCRFDVVIFRVRMEKVKCEDARYNFYRLYHYCTHVITIYYTGVVEVRQELSSYMDRSEWAHGIELRGLSKVRWDALVENVIWSVYYVLVLCQVRLL